MGWQACVRRPAFIGLNGVSNTICPLTLNHYPPDLC
jgi:hypothetical protein